MTKRRRAGLIANSGIRCGPTAFLFFKKLRDKIYQMTIFGKGEAQYLFELKKKARKKYEDAEKIEVVVKKPLTLTGYYDETGEHDPVVDAIFNSEKITKIIISSKADSVEFEPTRSFYLSPYSYNDNRFYQYATNNHNSMKASTGLLNFNIDDNCINYSSSGAGLYNKSKTTLIHYGSGMSSFNIELDTTSIEPVAVAFRGGINYVEIPNTNNDLNIKKYAFLYCEGLETLKVSKKVVKVGEQAFSGCPVESLYLASNAHRSSSLVDGWGKWFKDTLKYLEFYDNENIEVVSQEYYQCEKLEEVVPTNYIQYIRYGAFENCTALKTFNFDRTNSQLLTIDSNAFRNTGLINFIVPDNTTTIDRHCFENCKQLEVLTIGNNCSGYGYYCFNNCFKRDENNTTSYNGQGVLNLHARLNYNGPYLGSNAGLQYSYINILNLYNAAYHPTYGENLLVTNNCFEYCPMTVVNIDISETEYSLLRLEDYSFRGCPNLHTFNFDAIVRIDDYVFRDCTSLRSFVPNTNNLTYIGRGAFSRCTNLTNVKITANVEGTGGGNSSYAPFYYCTNITNVIYSSTKIIRSDYSEDNPTAKVPINYLFYEAGDNATLTITEGVIDIPAYAFYHFNFVNAITIPSSVRGLGSGAFSYSGISAVTFPNSFATAQRTSGDIGSVSSGKYIIEASVFSRCANLKTATLGSSMLALSYYMFSGSSLTSIDLKNVIFIGTECFRNCSDLKSIVFNIFPSIKDRAFAYCWNVSSVTIKGEETPNISVGTSVFTELGKNVYEAGENVVLTYNNINSTTPFSAASLRFMGGYFTHIYLTGVTTLGTNITRLYYSMPYLKYIEGNSLDTIPGYLCENCSNLTTASFSAATVIGYSAFSSCTVLSDVTITSVITLSGRAFSNCSSLTYVDISNVELISNEAFSNCTSLTNVKIKVSSDVIITYGAFYGCSALPNSWFNSLSLSSNSRMSIHIEDLTISGVTVRVNSSPFSYCTSLTDVNLPANFQITRGRYDEYHSGSPSYTTFYYYYNIFVHNNLSSITSSNARYPAKNNCIVSYVATSGRSGQYDNMHGAVIIGTGSSVIPTGSDTFTYFDGSTTITYTVDVIACGAFSGCSTLTSITIPENISSISLDVFKDCENLTSVTFARATNPSQASYHYAVNRSFNNCPQLTEIYLYEPVYINNNSFLNCNAISKVYYDSSNGRTKETYTNWIYSTGNSAILNATWEAI